MKITKEYAGYKIELLEVRTATYAGDFKIKIQFSDDTKRVVGFKSFLKNSLHPSIKRYLDEKRFKDFKIIDGNLNWNDYDLIFPIEDLYKGKI
jgi:hypothetical protein